jgi:glycosyltransferase involved in cell wall biosynthesis
MRILLLTQYFPPETGAPQNRLQSLARHLQKLGAKVTVLTAMPNYPKMEIFPAYKGRWFVKEEDQGIQIYRSSIFISKNPAFVLRLLNYFSFVFSSLFTGLFRISKHDFILCESPPLFLGLSAVLLKWFKGSKLIFNVSDLWPETAEKLGVVNNKALLAVSYSLEEFLYKQSVLVSGQTQGIVQNISKRFPLVNTVWVPNGIDLDQFNVGASGSNFRKKHQIGEEHFVLMYAGILGIAQGLDVILDAAHKASDLKDISFVIIGDGPESVRLKAKCESYQLKNLIFIGNIPRSEMSEAIASSNAYIVPLKKNDLFLGAIPSKLFEPLAMGKPILLGVDGEARNLFIEQGKAGLFFEPENSLALYESIIKLHSDKELLAKLGVNGMNYVIENFRRDKIAAKFYDAISLIW